MAGSIFLPVEFLGMEGERGERIMWEAIVKAYKNHEKAIGILNYTCFDSDSRYRYQPDILLATDDLGIVVIEVKTFGINKIKAIQANSWMMKNFYAERIEPFRQGENQIRQVLRMCDKERSLRKTISARVIIGLPLITRQEWMNRGFDPNHHTCPPLIFGDELSSRSIRLSIENNSTIINRGDSSKINQDQWVNLNDVLLGHPKSIKRESRLNGNKDEEMPGNKTNKTRLSVLSELSQWMSETDDRQARIALQIPPGPQRIRGIAGSGKTVLLCQKAARMHIQHPEWQIVLIFFTRSLHDLIPKEVSKWLKYFSGQENDFDLQNSNLKVLHAWGSQDRPGFYSILRNRAGRNAVVNTQRFGTPQELLAEAARDLLKNYHPEQIYDAVLIDEGQDISVDESYKYEDKQPIFWLAWQSLRPVSELEPSVRRLIWAYDEAQCLNSLKTPTYEEIFGRELALILSGPTSGPRYKGGAYKSEIMRKCFRTPGPILTAAHGIGMGLLRMQGLISGYSEKQDWENIGYKLVSGDFRRTGRQICLARPQENSPNPMATLWNDSLITFTTFSAREDELNHLVDQIVSNTQNEGLALSRQQLIIVVGQEDSASSADSRANYSVRNLQQNIAIKLQQRNLNFYIPGRSGINKLPTGNREHPDKFWVDNAMTIANIYQAKGHEASFVYILGLESIADNESSIALRNQLFVALTRSTAWVSMSGLKETATEQDYMFYEEVRDVIRSGNQFKFTYRRPPLAEVHSEVT